MGSGSSSRSKKSVEIPEPVESQNTLYLNYSKEIHKIRQRYQREDQQWIRDRISTLITQVVRETRRLQNVEVTVYIKDAAHVIGEGQPNKVTIVVREDLKNGDDSEDGIDVVWAFKTEGTFFLDTTKEVLNGIKKTFKGLWHGIVKILEGVKQDAIAGGGQLAIMSA